MKPEQSIFVNQPTLQPGLRDSAGKDWSVLQKEGAEPPSSAPVASQRMKHLCLASAFDQGQPSGRCVYQTDISGNKFADPAASDRAPMTRSGYAPKGESVLSPLRSGPSLAASTSGLAAGCWLA